jgi:hypothetical protein
MFPYDIDVYQWEYEQFQWDVHILIEGTLSAGIQFLNDGSKTEFEKLDQWMKKPISDEYHEHLVAKHVDVLATNDAQARFLRNMALVALVSRLTHSLHKMARSAVFVQRKEEYDAEDEFKELWREYSERFGIDFMKNASRIAFTDRIRVVRNWIVHNGGEAYKLKPFGKVKLNGLQSGWLKGNFSREYPEYVRGEGMNAEINVSQDLLNKKIEASIELVGWLAGELRKRELARMKRTIGTQ